MRVAACRPLDGVDNGGIVRSQPRSIWGDTFLDQEHRQHTNGSGTISPRRQYACAPCPSRPRDMQIKQSMLSMTLQAETFPTFQRVLMGGYAAKNHMKRIIFYSWQADLPNGTNRGFIERALQVAAGVIQRDDAVEIEPVVDRDIAGVGGAPDIASTIFAKIEAADVVVCDVSTIGVAGDRPVPNPNVLIELGYAIHAKGWNRVVMVLNEAYSEVEALPFDLRTHYVIQYRAEPEAADRSEARKVLASKLETQLRSIFASSVNQEPEEDPADQIIALIENNRSASLRSAVMYQAEKVVSAITDDRFSVKEDASPENYRNRVTDYTRICVPLSKILGTGCFYSDQSPLWIEVLDRVANAYEFVPFVSGPEWWFNLRLYPPLLLLHAAGIGAVAAGKYSLLRDIFAETKYFEHARNEKSLSKEVFTFKMRQTDLWNKHVFSTQQSKYTPVSDYLEEALREPLRSILPQSQRYTATVDRFEYLCGLWSFASDGWEGNRWGPMGTFMWRKKYQEAVKVELEREIQRDGNNSLLVKSGLVAADANEFLKWLNDFEEFTNRVRAERGLF